MTPTVGLAESVAQLRRFGRALARDSRFAGDERARAALVDSLSKRAALAARNGDASPLGTARLALFGAFIRLYRRQARQAALDDAGAEFVTHGIPGAAEGRGEHSRLERVVAGLPLELREALLLVTLERFSHVEAAEALDIPLVQLLERLARARASLAAGLVERRPSEPGGFMLRRAPHLRLIK